MRMATTADEINDELTRLIRECSSCQVAVAWSSVGFEGFDLLVRHKKKIERMVVGTHFYQTHPDFIESFLTHPSVRFVLNPDGVFHPKVYLFEKAGGKWECLVGSPNFTPGGVGKNDEIAILVTDRDHGAQEALVGVKSAIDGYWHKATPLGRDELAAYREAWQRKQPALRSVRGRFGNPDHDDEDDGGRTPLTVPILRMTWSNYYQEIETRSDRNPAYYSIEGRLQVIRAVRRLFAEYTLFREIEGEDRRRIAGLVEEDVNFLYFGSMRGDGQFQRAINTNDPNVSAALQAIPLTGPVAREDFLRFVGHYERAYSDGKVRVATATRLLAMKRPDTFVCLDARNKRGLCDAFRIGRSVGFEQYWDSIIGRVVDSAWWCSPAPGSGIELEVWQARAAFLDCLFYDGKDIADS